MVQELQAIGQHCLQASPPSSTRPLPGNAQQSIGANSVFSACGQPPEHAGNRQQRLKGLNSLYLPAFRNAWGDEQRCRKRASMVSSQDPQTISQHTLKASTDSPPALHPTVLQQDHGAQPAYRHGQVPHPQMIGQQLLESFPTDSLHPPHAHSATAIMAHSQRNRWSGSHDPQMIGQQLESFNRLLHLPHAPQSPAWLWRTKQL